jgi:rhamnosyltransferase
MLSSAELLEGGRLAIVVTAYKPADDLFARFAATIAACHCFIVVDNTPGGHTFGTLPQRVQLLQDGHNKGLGRALNLGIAAARVAGAGTVILFDQDSSPDAQLLRQLLATLDGAVQCHGDRVGVGPRLVDDGRPVRTTTGAQAPLKPIGCLPTSGLLFRLAPLRADQLFTEDLFIDFVDFDWCWRVGAEGWRFFRAMNVPMRHRLGLAQRRVLGLTYHVPAPYRHYFQFRDTLRLISRPYVPLYSKLRFAALLPVKALIYPFILDRGRERFGWMVRGLIDALKRVEGIGAGKETLGR